MPINERKFETIETAKNFILAGNAIFTLRSLRTGTWYTFKVQFKEAKGGYPESWMVLLLTGPDNRSNYQYIGQIKRGEFRTTKASKLSMDSAPVAGFNYAFRNLSNNVEPKNLEIWHAGKCGKCGRLLTTPESLAAGIGPICAEN